MFTEKELAKIARRENNNKRGYLVVNPLQGKHIPVIPSKALAMFQDLAQVSKMEGKPISSTNFESVGAAMVSEIEGKLPSPTDLESDRAALENRVDRKSLLTFEVVSAEAEKGNKKERLLVIGFAETATAIGAALAIAFDCPYIQTTREIIEDVSYLFFTEAHSHATEQKLVKEDVDSVLLRTDRVIFAEDEITTGNTILNLIHILEKNYGSRLCFSAASLLNGMDEECRSRFTEKGISLHYLVAAQHSEYSAIAMKYKGDGEYHPMPESKVQAEFHNFNADGYCNGRRLIQGSDYLNGCKGLWEQIHNHFTFTKGSTILVLGTEEFMYPALFAAGEMEKEGADVSFHATTRSPIEVSSEVEYPLHVRHELRSLYDRSRATYIYQLAKYDAVYIITDAPEKEEEGLYSLLNALIQNGNQTINVIRWCNF